MAGDAVFDGVGTTGLLTPIFGFIAENDGDQLVACLTLAAALVRQAGIAISKCAPVVLDRHAIDIRSVQCS